MPRISTQGSAADADAAERLDPDAQRVKRRRAALRLFEQGYGYKYTAKALGLAESTVRDWRRAYKKGCFNPNFSLNQHRFPLEVRDRVVHLRASGLSWNEIARRIGVSRSTCRKWVALEETAQADAAAARAAKAAADAAERAWRAEAQRRRQQREAALAREPRQPSLFEGLEASADSPKSTESADAAGEPSGAVRRGLPKGLQKP